MGSSAQNSSVVHWCRRRVRFNEVPEKVPEVRGFVQSQVRFNRLPEKVPEGEALVQSRVKFNRVPDKVPEKVLEKVLEKVPGSLDAKPSQAQQGPEKVPEKVLEKALETLVQSRVRFNRIPEREAFVQSQVRFSRVRRRFRRRSGGGFAWCRASKVLEKVWEALVQSRVKVEQGSEQGSQKGSGRLRCRARSCRFNRRRFRRRSGRLWCRARSSSTGFRRRFQSFNRVQEALVQGQVQVPEEVPEKAWKAVVQSQVRFNRVSEKVPENFPGSLGAEPSQAQQVQKGFQRFALQHASERFVK